MGVIDEIPGECDFIDSFLICGQEVSMGFRGTHIGASTNVSAGQVRIDTNRPCTTPDQTSGFEFDSFQAGAIVAANGDELWFESLVSGCGDGVTRTEPVGSYVFTGGTGRFADATGTGTVEVDALAGGALSARWSGLISY